MSLNKSYRERERERKKKKSYKYNRIQNKIYFESLIKTQNNNNNYIKDIDTNSNFFSDIHYGNRCHSRWKEFTLARLSYGNNIIIYNATTIVDDSQAVSL